MEYMSFLFVPGEAFTDENIIEFEEPPLIPKRLRGNMEQNKHVPVNMEAELIRLKNEPYKRRRSRKSFEKVDIVAPLRRQAPHVCVVCYEMFPDTSKLRVHMRQHHEDVTFTCKFCDYLANSKTTLVRHVKMLHENSPGSSSSAGCPEADVDSCSRSDGSSVSGNAYDAAALKSESDVNADFSGQSDQEHAAKTEREVENTQGDAEVGNEGAVDIKEAAEKDEILDVVSVKKEEDEDCTEADLKNAAESDDEPKDTVEKNRVETQLNSHTQGETDEIKEEIHVESPKENEAPQPQTLGASKSSTTSRPATPLTPLNGQDGQPVSDSEGAPDPKLDKCSTRYCKQCDIPFMQLTSFIAHKKHYCSSRASEKQIGMTKV